MCDKIIYFLVFVFFLKKYQASSFYFISFFGEQSSHLLLSFYLIFLPHNFSKISSHFPANYQIPLELHSMIFTASAPLGRFNHRVAMSVCVSVPVRHRAHFLKRFFNDLEITQSVLGLVNPKPQKKEKITHLNFFWEKITQPLKKRI